MARPTRRSVSWGQFLAARVAGMTLEMFDPELTRSQAARVGRLLYRFDRRHRQRTESHLRLAFPGREEAWIRRVAAESFEHFVRLVTEVLHTPRQMTPANWSRHVRFGKVSEGLAALTEPGPTLLVTGHVGNWEVVGHLLPMLGFEVDALARPIDNPLVNRWLLDIRQRRGLRVLTKWDATGRMLEVLDRGGTLGFIADQNAGDKGLFVPFFGRLASSYKSIALLAVDRRIPVLCGGAHRLEDGTGGYEMWMEDVIHPDAWAGHPDPVFYVTARYVRAIERMVRRRPAQYLWMHRRWKSRPRHERLGRPAPARLRRNLESLPWLEAEAIDRLLGAGGAGGAEGAPG